MAFNFINASQKYVELPTPVVSVMPMTFSAWIRPTEVTGMRSIVCLSGATNGQFVVLRQNNTKIQAVSRQNVARTATAYFDMVANTWYHVAGVFLSTARYAYVNGGNKGSSSGASDPVVSPGTTSVGRTDGASPPEASYFTGDIAEAAIWNTNLTDNEIYILSLGYEPTFVRLQNLKSYVPLLNHSSGWDGSTESGKVVDNVISGGYTVYNNPTMTNHPRMFYGKRKMLVPPFFQPAWYTNNVNNNCLYGGAIVS